ncbi:metal-dependent hydrolase family protein [Luteithermobacter gelatinilyticus]|uniref:metal-dependent hydrolase family protein n=1 Tax=Luteithermobacter gelatinilyticus TaxID=2582913 RepID=UPI0011063A1D|nr:amidohydrolase family protein [Luteithermobacter gelatinilyticus]
MKTKIQKTLLLLPLVLSNLCISGPQVSLASETGTVENAYQVIHVGRLLAVPGQDPLEKQTLLIKNAMIKDIRNGFVSPEELGHKSARLIDLRDKFVLPGLMDMHVHLTMTDLERPGSGKAGADAYQLLEGLKNAQKTLQAGFTTVRNVGSHGYAIFALRDAINRGDFPGPRILAAGHTLFVTTDETYPGACYNVESCRKAVRSQIEMGADVIKIYATCSGSQPCGRQDASPLFLEDEFYAIVETARTRNIPVTAHAHGTDGINAALRAGVKSIEHGSYNDATSHKLFKKQKAFLVPTLSVQDNIQRDYQTATKEMKHVMEDFMRNHPVRTYEAFQQGVKIAAGSDAGVTLHGQNARELQWYVKIGMSEMEALKTATVHAAALIGLEDRLGTLEIGKIADLIAVDGNPLENINALGNVVFVMKEGTVFIP